MSRLRPSFLVPTIALAAAALPVVGCSPFRAIQLDGRCGNQVLEPSAGEDCDSWSAYPDAACGEPGSAHACRYVCGGNTRCPAGFACGLDGACRASAGRFGEPDRLPVNGSPLVLGDVNGDGRLDVVAVEEAGLGIYLGDPRGGLTRTAGFDADVGRSTIRLGHFDAGPEADAAMLLDRAPFLAHGDVSGELRPVAYPMLRAPAGSDAYRLIPLRATPPFDAEDVLALSIEMDGRIHATVLDAVDTDDGALAAIGPAQAFASHLGVGDVDSRLGGASSDEVTIAPRGATVAWVFSLDCAVDGQGRHCALRQRSRVDLAGLPPTDISSINDLDGDGNPDLLFHVSPAARGMTPGPFAVAWGDGTGGFHAQRTGGPPAATAEPMPSLACPFCKSGFSDPIAIADLDADGRPDLITQNGIYLVRSTAPWVLEKVVDSQPVYWDDAVVTDFNRDGLQDVAAISGGASGVDLLIGLHPGAFNHLHATTTGINVRELRSGDFDGDLVEDLAVIVEGRRVMVLFADAQGLPRARELQADVPGAERIEPVARGGGRADDLLVIARPTSGVRHVTRLRSTGGQVMRSSVGLDDPIDFMVTGHLGPTDDDLDDMLLVGGPGPQGRGVWLLETANAATGDVPRPVPLTVLPSPAQCPQLTQSGAALLVARDLDGDGHDEVVVLDAEPISREPGPNGPPRFRAGWARVRDGRIECHPLAEVAGVFWTRALEVADADGDGRPDLIATLHSAPPRPDDPDFTIPVPMPGMPGPGFAIYFGQPDPEALFADQPVYYGADLSTEAVTVVGRRIAVIEATGGWLGVLGPGRALERLPIPLPLGVLAPGVDHVQAADLDGDGLDDLVLGGVVPAVLRQQECDAREVSVGQCMREGP